MNLPMQRHYFAVGSSRIDMERSWFSRLLGNPMFKSFLLFSIFRAFYGAGILLVTWFLATETENPWWVSILFLLASMIFSRLLFRFIKSFRKSVDDSN
ncbi:MAG: hypothetical protein ACJZ49_01750 [Candidatus Thalassarchaeaceae archaeon]|nr:MAG: hypothetical protein CMA04_002615 [Euryarchaeota archaeon]RPG75382.1 MAG: hypothetical protein CBC45_002175 [Euryarchaeota archaeon TMED85]